MAGVRVRVEDFEDGVYPDVCASTGASGGARLYRTEATFRPAWVWLLLFAGPAGFFGALVLSFVLQRSVAGYVPYTDAAQETLGRRRTHFGQGAVAGLAVLVGALVLGLANDSESGFRVLAVLGFVAGGLGVVICAFLWFNLPGSVGVKLESNGRWVVLEPVSPRFAAAYDERESRRRIARRQAAVEAEDELRQR